MDFIQGRSHSLEFYDVFTKNRFLPVKFNSKYKKILCNSSLTSS